MSETNPKICKSRYDDEGFYIFFFHPKKADFRWIGHRFHSEFGGGVGLAKFINPEMYATKEEAEEALKIKVMPWIEESKPSWLDYVKV